MTHSKPDAAGWLLILLFAATIGAAMIGMLTATAQTASEDSRAGIVCPVAVPVADPYRQGPNFDLKVSFRDQPVSGMKLVLTDKTVQPDPVVVATADTDRSGVAHFLAVRPGFYEAHVEEGLLAPVAEIEVEAGRSGEGQVAIEWPWAPSITRKVRGQLYSWQKDSPQNPGRFRPFANAVLQLFDLRSGKMVASTHTDVDGDYEFPNASDGLYVVRISQAKGLSRTAYDKAVEVASRASRDSLVRLGVDFVCGLALIEVPDAVDQDKEAVAAARASTATNY